MKIKRKSKKINENRSKIYENRQNGTLKPGQVSSPKACQVFLAGLFGLKKKEKKRKENKKKRKRKNRKIFL